MEIEIFDLPIEISLALKTLRKKKELNKIVTCLFFQFNKMNLISPFTGEESEGPHSYNQREKNKKD